MRAFKACTTSDCPARSEREARRVGRRAYQPCAGSLRARATASTVKADSADRFCASELSRGIVSPRRDHLSEWADDTGNHRLLEDLLSDLTLVGSGVANVCGRRVGRASDRAGAYSQAAVTRAAALECKSEAFCFVVVDGTALTLKDWKRSKHIGSVGSTRDEALSSVFIALRLPARTAHERGCTGDTAWLVLAANAEREEITNRLDDEARLWYRVTQGWNGCG